MHRSCATSLPVRALGAATAIDETLFHNEGLLGLYGLLALREDLGQDQPTLCAVRLLTAKFLLQQATCVRSVENTRQARPIHQRRGPRGRASGQQGCAYRRLSAGSQLRLPAHYTTRPAPMDRPDPRPIKQPPPLQTYDLKLAPLIVIGGKIKKVVLTDNRAGLGTICSPPP